MGLRIGTNVPSLKAQRALEQTSMETEKSLSRLSSGKRIVNAADDSAGLSISQNLEAQVRGLNQARRNSNDGISLVQTAEGSMNEISNILIRLRELGVQSASDTVGESERGFLNTEYQTLKAEIDRIANSTTFNGTPLLNGEGSDELSFQVGIYADENNQITYNAGKVNVRTSELDIDGLGVSTKDDAKDSLASIDVALNRVNEHRAGLGAMQNRLQSTSAALGVTAENLSTAKSRIIDTDIAKATSNLVKSNILQSAGVAVLSQANSSPKQALQLL